MAVEAASLSVNSNEDDDAATYFLKPANSPYNINMKVQQANYDLFNSTPQMMRSSKVQFKEALISYEPDLTDDDVTSIQSEQIDIEENVIIEEILEENHEIQNNRYTTVLREDLKIKENFINEFETIEEAEDTIIEELLPEDSNNEADEILKESNLVEDEGDNKDNPMTTNTNEEAVDILSKTKMHKLSKTKSRRRKQSDQRVSKNKELPENLSETYSSEFIRKIEIQGKSKTNSSSSRQYQRQCCNGEQKSKKLPNYNGFNSEYGLSYSQLKNRTKHLEQLKQKELARQKMIEEYKLLKFQQNEKVFNQWLKNAMKRTKQKNIQQYKNSIKGESQISKPVKQNNFQRPKTTETIKAVPKISTKKRPHTTSPTASVRIEVSRKTLNNKGIFIGDLLIANSKDLSKKFNILSVS